MGTPKKPGTLQHFLIIFDREHGKQIKVEKFGSNITAALDAYSQTEREYADNPRMDIVLVGAESLDAVRVTHGSYFAEEITTVEQVIAEAEEYLQSILSDCTPQKP